MTHWRMFYCHVWFRITLTVDAQVCFEDLRSIFSQNISGDMPSWTIRKRIQKPFSQIENKQMMWISPSKALRARFGASFFGLWGLSLGSLLAACAMFVSATVEYWRKNATWPGAGFSWWSLARCKHYWFAQNKWEIQNGYVPIYILFIIYIYYIYIKYYIYMCTYMYMCYILHVYIHTYTYAYYTRMLMTL